MIIIIYMLIFNIPESENTIILNYCNESIKTFESLDDVAVEVYRLPRETKPYLKLYKITFTYDWDYEFAHGGLTIKSTPKHTQEIKEIPIPELILAEKKG